MIRPFSEEDAWCYWVISVGALLSFLGFIVACICSCRRSETKNEFLGLAGMVTLNSAENESFAGIPNDVSARASVQDAADVGKRTTGANRSLPDIPKDRRHDDTTESVSQDIYETTETIADNSELYATVQGAGLAAEVSEQEMQQQVDQRNSSIRKNSARRYSRFAVVASDNVEHPYAQLQDVQKIEANQGLNRGNVRSAIETKKPSTSVSTSTPTSTSTSQGGETNPVAPPRTRRSSSHNSLLSDDIGTCGGEIQAATAISGGVQANQELPYMTPPLSMLLPSSQSQLQSVTPSATLSQPQSQSQSQSQSESLSQLQPQSQFEPQPQSQLQPLRSCQPQSNSPQQHFSGDSQDSKGYTSISVREPLANIIAQTKTICRQSQSSGRPLVDSHYATVSDDSDEMYAAIDEQDKVYTSGSETYAQIQPTTEAQRPTQTTEPTSFPRAPSRSDEAQPAAPQPPSVDSLRHVAHAHSRQASSSSANSSIANPGSPKPEKRQANSPLPPPPEGTMDMYASIDKRTSKTEERSKSTLSNGKSLEDMYAKVMKKKKEAEEQSDAHASLYSGSLHHEVPAVPATTAVAATAVAGTAVRKTSLVEPNRTSWSSHDSAETQRKELDSAGCSFSSVNPDVSKLLQVGGVVGEIAIDSYSSKDPRCSHDHGHGHDYGYEAVASDPLKKRASRDPNYEPLRPQSNPTVDTVVASANASTSGGGVAATASTAATAVATATGGYSSSVRNATDLAASYNALNLKHRQASNASSEDPGYEKVRLRRRIDADHDTDSEPNYESMPHDSGEPNYASVCRPGDSDTDPNYESVNHGDPNYESVKYMSVNRSVADDPPYEQVHGFKADPNPDGYEQVKKHRGFYSADYERIQLNRSTESIGNGDTDDEQYVQV
ncbi:uncharacterized protein LOC143216734 isoform X2 [Lasioglossum baleicum]|uniref:uncharacterized protein LOC143216734 isoform X2 n=1 Tax=Lasioglossum baleicum TaxID=434251 RepID=UPI003FCE810D